MTSAELPVGLYAVTSWRGKRQLAFRTTRNGGTPWCVLDGSDTRGLADHEVIARHPLVAVDPCDAPVTGATSVIAALYQAHHAVRGQAAEQRILQWLITLFENATWPPMSEPTGLGAVVEAHDGTHWVRLKPAAVDEPWHDASDTKYPQSWSSLRVGRVLSEGVE
jgi:hypothetical protein